jgi:hypothetical protein
VTYATLCGPAAYAPRHLIFTTSTYIDTGDNLENKKENKKILVNKSIVSIPLPLQTQSKTPLP